jgi:uncharacterized protein
VTTSTYLWRRLDLDGLDFVRLDEGGNGVSAQGYEICAEDDERWAVRFDVTLDRGWRHEVTTVEVVHDAGTHRLELASDDRGSWTRDGRPDPSLEGCTVIDLAGNPFTNAFVTRAVALDAGAGVEVRAAYIETPPLTVRRLVQRYQRLADDQWLYADDEFGQVEFRTDADGIVVSYEGLAERL